MKKIYFTAALFAFTVSLSQAQPIINASDINNNVTLETFLAEDVPNLSPGNAGANQTWDFSSIQSISLGATVNVPFAESPHTGLFTLANNSSRFLGSLGEIWSYFRISSTKYEEIGLVYTGVAVVNLSADPRTLVEFPYTYNKVINDTYKASNTPTVASTTTYDAYGTLRLSFGTFTNVIRQKREEGIVTEYTWFNSSPFYPLCVVNVSNNDNSITMNRRLSDLATENINEKTIFSVSPNPTSGMLYLNYGTNAKAVEIAIYDVSGKLVFDKKESHSENIDVANLNPGLYFLKITAANGQSSIQKFVRK